MKKKVEAQKKAIELPKGFTIQPGLDEEFENQPFFQQKADKANFILKKFGLPKNQPHQG